MSGLTGYRHVLVVTAVEAERAAVLAGAAPGLAADGLAADGLAAAADGQRTVVLAGGVGSAAAAAAAAQAIERAAAAGHPYDAVLSAGIGGGFAGQVEVGGLVIGSYAIAADLGAASPDGFTSIDELGFGTATLVCDPALVSSLGAAIRAAATGPVLTVNTVTGTSAGTAELRHRHPDAVAEAMEGYGVACAAALAGVPFAELRAVSNVVGPRDRAAWRIPAALAALSAAFAALATVEG
jgi:futalosine hydrolase